jgi:hypothetical protein
MKKEDTILLLTYKREREGKKVSNIDEKKNERKKERRLTSM